MKQHEHNPSTFNFKIMNKYHYVGFKIHFWSINIQQIETSDAVISNLIYKI